MVLDDPPAHPSRVLHVGLSRSRRSGRASAQRPAAASLRRDRMDLCIKGQRPHLPWIEMGPFDRV